MWKRDEDTERDCAIVFDRPMITACPGNMVCMDRVCFELVRMIHYPVLNVPTVVLGRTDSSPYFYFTIIARRAGNCGFIWDQGVCNSYERFSVSCPGKAFVIVRITVIS